MPTYTVYWPKRPCTIHYSAATPAHAAWQYAEDQSIPLDLLLDSPLRVMRCHPTIEEVAQLIKSITPCSSNNELGNTMFVYGEMDVPQVDHYASGLRETLGDELRRRGMILLGAKDDVLFAEDPFGMRRMYSARLWDCSLDDPFDDLVSGSRLLAWCDGSGVPTDKVVGAGAVVKAADGSVSVERSWSCGPGTNNVAEITGISLALATCSRMDLPITLYADSKYALGVVSNPSWTPKANLKLVKEAQALAMFRSVRFEHVRGHAGNEGNERADKLAGMARVR